MQKKKWKTVRCHFKPLEDNCLTNVIIYKNLYVSLMFCFRHRIPDKSSYRAQITEKGTNCDKNWFFRGTCHKTRFSGMCLKWDTWLKNLLNQRFCVQKGSYAANRPCKQAVWCPRAVVATYRGAVHSLSCCYNLREHYPGNATHSMAAAPKIFYCALNFNFYLASTGKICLEKPAG